MSEFSEENECFLIEIDSNKSDSELKQLFVEATETQVSSLRGASFPKFSPLLDKRRMLEGDYCSRDLVEALWREKNRLDTVFDDKQERLYYKARDATFPQDRHGSERSLLNRAGDKLLEVHETVLKLQKNQIEQNNNDNDDDDKDKNENSEKPNGVFAAQRSTDRDVWFDICGGPGAWSESALTLTDMPGFGMTLDIAMTSHSERWYPKLKKDSRWRALWGADGTGNVYSPENFHQTLVDLQYQRVVLVMGDGGFAVSKNDAGEHQENLQELFSARIILSELLFGAATLASGGNFVCKLFDVFSQLTGSIVYATALLFEQTIIVKPRRSRIVNSERYLVGIGRKSGEIPKLVVETLQNIHSVWNEKLASDAPMNDTAVAPVSVVPPKLLELDSTFQSSLSKCAIELCEKQTKALQVVLDQVDVLKNKKSSDFHVKRRRY